MKILQAHPTIQKWWLPLLSVFLLCVLMGLTPPATPKHDPRTLLDTIAHNLGHAINSVWVGISLILLVVPSLISTWVHKRPDLWAWRVLDAILLDFLMVDALGKDIFKGLGRPGRLDQPGFPSGHATMAFLMAWLVWQRFPRLGPLWFSMATLISWSRVQSQAHFPYQVLAGALYGCGLGALMISRKTGVLLPRILWSDEKLRRALRLAQSKV
ncbi:PAP2 superfamily protein [Abditibacterium utsteinense]|uniref:PAP2 superfamily protein n=1 Tax=Abditibacterium utsteinense TaxID=1960156 RepID=A0A2S8SP93_9BACT|nr:phosphatase PAP2 family protein [Abditibacterium utsteinense]PQV62611.1 PAP2 superfamily protein [Abditibacterium utsteinense]